MRRWPGLAAIERNCIYSEPSLILLYSRVAPELGRGINGGSVRDHGL